MPIGTAELLKLNDQELLTTPHVEEVLRLLRGDTERSLKELLSGNQKRKSYTPELRNDTVATVALLKEHGTWGDSGRFAEEYKVSGNLTNWRNALAQEGKELPHLVREYLERRLQLEEQLKALESEMGEYASMDTQAETASTLRNLLDEILQDNTVAEIISRIQQSRKRINRATDRALQQELQNALDGKAPLKPDLLKAISVVFDEHILQSELEAANALIPGTDASGDEEDESKEIEDKDEDDEDENEEEEGDDEDEDEDEEEDEEEEEEEGDDEEESEEEITTNHVPEHIEGAEGKAFLEAFFQRHERASVVPKIAACIRWTEKQVNGGFNLTLVRLQRLPCSISDALKVLYADLLAPAPVSEPKASPAPTMDHAATPASGENKRKKIVTEKNAVTVATDAPPEPAQAGPAPTSENATRELNLQIPEVPAHTIARNQNETTFRLGFTLNLVTPSGTTDLTMGTDDPLALQGLQALLNAMNPPAARKQE